MKIRNFFLVVFLICAFVSNAQIKNIINRMSFQLEIGKNYVDLRDKANKYDGWGWYTSSNFTHVNFPFSLEEASSFNFAAKIFYNEKHILVYRNTSYYSGSERKLVYPNMGFDGFSFEINSLGYGYKLLDRKLGISLFLEAVYRVGAEGYIYDWYSLTRNIYQGQGATLSYSKPWGLASSVDIEYFITKNIGLGANLGFMYFPWENAKMEGEYLDSINPELRDKTKPNQKIFIGTVKLIYKFRLPKYKVKA